MKLIRIPAIVGPAKIVARFAAWKNAVAVATSPCSSPTSSGTTVRCTVRYGERKTPLAATSASRTGNGSAPMEWRRGIAAKIGARRKSDTSIVRLVPMRLAIAPPQNPVSEIGRISAIRTHVIFCGEPVVRSTNQGIATHVICVPVDEITSATSSVASRRSLSSFTLRLGDCAETDDDAARAAAVGPAPDLVEQLLEPLAELVELLRRQLERRRRCLAARRQAAGSSCSRRSASRMRCCCRPTSSSRSTVASRPSEGNSIRDAVARHGRSRPAPPAASSTKPHFARDHRW